MNSLVIYITHFIYVEIFTKIMAFFSLTLAKPPQARTPVFRYKLNVQQHLEKLQL